MELVNTVTERFLSNMVSNYPVACEHVRGNYEGKSVLPVKNGENITILFYDNQAYRV